MILTCREQRLGILLSTLHGPGQTHRDNDLASKGNSAAAAGKSYNGEYRCSITLTCVYICLCGSDGKESACNAGDPDLTPGWEDPLEGGVATHSSILAWRIPWTEEPGGLRSIGSEITGHD